MNRRRPVRGRDDGVVVVIVALMLTGIFVAAALAIDISNHVNERQQLHDTLDAAAHAGAFELPGSGAAVANKVEAAVRTSVQANDPALNPNDLVSQINYFCVVASEAVGDGTYRPAAYTIPAVCSTASTNGRVCDARMCATPCNLRAGDRCNTVRLGSDKDVEYRFGPVIGQDQGNTGSLTSVACKGPCARLQGAPLDIVFIVDRSTSMLECKFWLIVCWNEVNHVGYVRDALNGVGSAQGIFDLLLPDRHRVALGTIHKAKGANSCESATGATQSGSTWIPVALTNAFGKPSTVRTVVNCLPSNLTSFTLSGGHTDFQGPIDAAAAVLRTAPQHPTKLVPRRAIIFLSDGEPNLPTPKPCQSAIDAANRAKINDEALVITIAYKLTSSNKCGSGDYSAVEATDLLAAMASRPSLDTPSANVNYCKSGSPQTENTDGDHFFCAPNPEDLLPVFQAALAAITDDITLLKLPF